jgi:flavodoxin
MGIKKMKTVVAYYSRTGHTKFIAEKIAQKLGADLCEIIDKKKREGKLGFLGGGNDALREKLTDIEVSKPIEGYDFVIIGSPVWAGKIAPAIRKFIVTNNFTEKMVALFVTLDGNKPEKSLENMKAAISTKRLIGEIGFIRPMGNEEKTEEQVKTWCSELGKSLGPA